MYRQWYNTRHNDDRKNDIEFVNCGNPMCNRTLELSKYILHNNIRDGVETERIHEVCEPRLRDVVILCTCGHFTRFTV
jgi:hypothetical protein